MLVDIQTVDGVYLAKIICEYENTYKLRYMIAKNKQLYDYDKEEDEVEKACVCGFYDEDDTEETAGFYKVEGGFMKKDEDDDYEPSECSDSDSEESLVDSDDDEDSQSE
jgi:hypothetical protein